MNVFYEIKKNDARTELLAELLHRRGCVLVDDADMVSDDFKTVYVFAPNYVLNDADVLNIKSRSTVFCGRTSDGCAVGIKRKNIKIFEFLKDETFAVENAGFTAEAALQILLGLIDRQLSAYKIAVVGYGRCGRALTKYLFCLNADFEVVSGKPENAAAFCKAAAYADFDCGKYDVIINTAPRKIISDERLPRIKKEAVIMDLASSPYGLNHERARELGINSRAYPALPSKLRARACAELMAEYILKNGENEND